MDLLIGCDPELFVRDASGKLVTAHGLVAGNKKNPLKVDNGAVQVDGMALEINITPAKTRQEFITNIRSVQNQLQSLVPLHKLCVEPTAVFEREYFDRCPAVCKELGCEPDWDAYSGEMNKRPETTEPFRTAAGHIHVGWCTDAEVGDPNHFEDCRLVAKQLDWYLGIWSLTWDKDNKRRSLYGRAGCFRPKTYGMEYRALSNAWLRTDELIGWVFDKTALALNSLDEGQNQDALRPNRAQEIINGNITDWQQRYGYIMQSDMPPGGYWGPEKKAA